MRLLMALAVVLFAMLPLSSAGASPVTALNCDEYHYDAAGSYLDIEAGSDPLIYAETHSAGIQYDRAGIPLLRYGEGFFYNPVFIAQNGLYALGRGDARRAIAMGDWFVQTQSKSGAWFYRFSITIGRYARSPHVPWVSGMAQGQAISLLTRLYRVTHRLDYLRVAQRALTPLQKSTARGGVRAMLFGHPFYEEAPTKPPTFILNGFMYTLFGLHDLATLLPRSAAPRLFTEGMRTLIFALPLYDGGRGESYYDLRHIFDPPQRALSAFGPYSAAHVLSLCALNSIQPHPVLRFYRDLWRTGVVQQNSSGK